MKNISNLKVNLTIDECTKRIREGGYYTTSLGELIDEYTLEINDKKCCTMVFNYWFFRCEYISISIVVDNFNDFTRVHGTVSGGPIIDLGARKKYLKLLERILSDYIIE